MTNETTHTERLSAIFDAGSRAYTVHAGATLTRMTELAKNGDLEEFRRTAIDHIAIHPTDRQHVIGSVPTKILNQYIYVHRGRAYAAVERWRIANPDWAEQLERSMPDPGLFRCAAEAMAEAVAREEHG